MKASIAYRWRNAEEIVLSGAGLNPDTVFHSDSVVARPARKPPVSVQPPAARIANCDPPRRVA
jgi:hypothetical protein